MVVKEVIETNGVSKACSPITRVIAMAIIQNPFAGCVVADLPPLYDVSGQLGEHLIGDAVTLLSGAAVSYGKALTASDAKAATMGTPIDLPLSHKDEPWSFDHFDTITVIIADAPRPDKIILCMGVADSGRSYPRLSSALILD